MKKFLFTLVTALLLAPLSSFADSWTKTVTTLDEFKSAFNSVGTGIAGETYEIICDWDASTLVSVGSYKPSITNGRLVIRSNQTDFEKMPQLAIRLNSWTADCDTTTTAAPGQRYSMIFENMNMVGSGANMIDCRHFVVCDTVAFRNCQLHGTTRTFIRYDNPTYNDTQEHLEKQIIDVLEISNCMLYNEAVSSGDNWSVVRTFIPVNTFNVTGNLFYNMPYTKSLWETRAVVENPTTCNFTNNLVLLGNNGDIATTGFTLLNPSSNVAPGSLVNIYNNILVGPQAGTNVLVNDTSNYRNTNLCSLASGTIFTGSNVLDTATYKNMALQTTYAEGNYSVLIEMTPTTEINGRELSWAKGELFQDAANDMYYLLKSNPWYTAGINVETFESDGTPIGPAMMYKDEFPVEASLTVNIDGPSYITYSVSPEKTQYYVGDEVTISLTDHNSNYLSLNTFNGWSDGVETQSRTLTIAGDTELTASFTETNKAIAIFDMVGISGTLTSYDANIYYNDDDTYKAVLTSDNYVSSEVTEGEETTTVYTWTKGASFQTRAEKFGEDDADLRMAVVSRRTPAAMKTEGHATVNVEFCTTGFSGITVSGYTGTDNNMSTDQYIEASLDGETWTKVGSATAEAALKWLKVEATLPSDYDNQEKVYIRFNSDPTAGYVYYDASVTSGMSVDDWYPTVDAFEYVGNILIAYENSATAIAGVSAEEEAAQAAAVVKAIKNGQIVIIKDGKEYNAAGVQMK